MIQFFMAESGAPAQELSIWFQIFTQGGAVGLLALLLFWFAPKLLKHIEDKDKMHAESLKSMNEMHRAERAEERKAYTEVINRNTDAIEMLRSTFSASMMK